LEQFFVNSFSISCNREEATFNRRRIDVMASATTKMFYHIFHKNETKILAQVCFLHQDLIIPDFYETLIRTFPVKRFDDDVIVFDTLNILLRLWFCVDKNN